MREDWKLAKSQQKFMFIQDSVFKGSHQNSTGIVAYVGSGYL